MTLTSRQRVAAAIRGEPVDHIPTGPLAVHSCAELTGVSLKDYTLSAEQLSRAVLRYAELFEPDAVWVSADTWVTAQAMGAEVAFVDDNQPLAGTGAPRIQSAADVATIPVADVTRLGRYSLMVEATKRIRDGVGDDRCVVSCFDQYPFSVACALMGIERAMIAPLEEPTLLQDTMRKAADFAVAYGQALAAAGADVLSGGDSPGALLGPVAYEDVVAPIERDVIARLKNETGRHLSLHICGDATRLLTAMAGTGADILEVDHQVSIDDAARVCGPNIALWGNLDPVGVLLSATPEEVAAATTRLLQQVQDASHRRFIASSGCTLSPGTPVVNLQSLFETVWGFPVVDE
jgi:uroporphyrinogen decarboxylase